MVKSCQEKSFRGHGLAVCFAFFDCRHLIAQLYLGIHRHLSPPYSGKPLHHLRKDPLMVGDVRWHIKTSIYSRKFPLVVEVI